MDTLRRNEQPTTVLLDSLRGKSGQCLLGRAACRDDTTYAPKLSNEDRAFTAAR